jgi:hypothetical protein
MSVQTGLPVPHEMLAVLHGSLPVQDAPGEQTQLPPEQTRLLPQLVPFETLPFATQTIVPVAQDVAPVLHVAGVHGAFAVQATQLPALQTMLVPQSVPFGSVVPVSVQEGMPVAHERVPPWQWLVGVHADPGVQATQLPPLQT